jgi:hypothetical protein
MSGWISYVGDLLNGLTPWCKLPHSFNRGFTLQGARVSLTNVCSRYNKDFPSPSPCVRTLNIMATKDTNSQSASGWVQSTVESERMGRISSLKSFKRTEDKWTGKLQRTPNGFRIHEAPRPNEDS